MVSGPISDFEAQRLANIAERNALLKQLNLQSKAQAIVGNKKAALPRRSRNQDAATDDEEDDSSSKGGGKGGKGGKRTEGPAAKRVKRERVEPSGPRRMSSRLAGIQAGSEKAEEVDKALLAAAAAKEEQERLQRLRRQEDIEFEGSLVLGTDVLLGEKGKYERTFDYNSADIKGDGDGDGGNVKALRERINKLALWDAFEPARLKVVPERIYAMVMHPTETKPIIFAGDKIGNLGILDASQAGANRVKDEADVQKERKSKVKREDGDDDDAETEEEPSITTIKPHARTISAMHTHPDKPETLYTASYDSSIRATDLHKSVAVEVYGPADPNQDEPLSGVDMADNDVHVLYFTTLDGSLGIYDTRSSPAKGTTIYQLSDKKIGGFSLNPVAPHYLATASLDRTMKLWDLRKINKDNNLPTLVGEHESRLSVSHAAFNSAGQVATSSYDDTIKIHSFGVAAGNSSKNKKQNKSSKRSEATAPMTTWPAGHTIDSSTQMKPEIVIRHNNQTGRWVTILRPQWQRRPTDGLQKFVIGNMSRFVDVFAADGTQLAQLGDDEGRITAVPAVAVWHDTREWVVGGNASGKVFLWM